MRRNIKTWFGRLYLSTLVVSSFTAVVYVSSVMAANAIFYRRLHSDGPEYDRLEHLVAEEKDLIGLKKNLAVSISTDIKTSSSYCYTESDCIIKIKKGHPARIVLRHELYHLAEHGARNEPLFEIKSLNLGFYPKFFFYQEPAANVYALTGLKF